MTTVQRRQPTQPWVHFAAGASAGIATAILTSPLDVLRTRLQSDLYQSSTSGHVSGYASRYVPRLVSAPFGHILETFSILRSISSAEGWRGLFRGIGPSLAGVVPASAVKFYVYGNCKRLGARYLNCGEDEPSVHAQAAVAAGLATATATNPIWLIKTRLQLDKSRSGKDGTVVPRQYSSSLDCARKVVQAEGVPGLFRGLSASYLGTAETVLHLVLYERLKTLFSWPTLPTEKASPLSTELQEWAGTSGAAGLAKVVAVLVTYPHEVLRTRLRQAPTSNGAPAYTGLWQCFQKVWKQERWRGLYGGLTPHLVRSIPSAIISLGVYEFVLRMSGFRAVND